MLQIVVIIEMKPSMCYNKLINYGIGVLMKEAKNKRGFTLAEVMIVLLVLTILFAAFAPFITKRRRSAIGKQEVWMWSSRNYMAGPMDIYYRPLSDSYLGGIYIGVTPDSENEIKESYLPLSKLVVRSGYILGNTIQRQLQLRYGRNSFDDPGQLAATFLADGSNLLFGGIYPYIEKCSDSSYPKGNVAFGYYTMNSIKDTKYNTNIKACDPNINNDGVVENNTAFGYNSLASVVDAKDNTAIGANSGLINQSGWQNTLVGYNAGSNTLTSANTLIGYNSQSMVGSYNTFIGADTGNAKECTNCNNINRDYRNNVALGYKALGNIIAGENNVAIGAGALSNLTYGNYNVAIGYNSCLGITEQSYKTCIGAWSGPALDTPVYNELGIPVKDDTPRTYIGANPNITSDGKWAFNSKYGGDAVLEIHNASTNNDKLNNSPVINSNATTIINGNLIVKGKTYFTIGNVLYPFYYNNNIFGTDANTSCASDQLTYNFSNSGRCADLAPITGTSDRRLKNITSKNYNGLEKIKQLKVYNYKFKNDKQKKNHVGVIAQDLQKIFPNSVFKDSNGYLKIRIDEIFYAVINSLKELNNKIITLIKQTSAFEEKITKMEKENQKLNQQINDLTARINALKSK